jgi:hypothetical protein
MPFAYAEYLIQMACQKSCEPKRDLFRSVITTEAKFIAFRCTDAKCVGLSQYAISTWRIIHAGTVRKALGCKGKRHWLGSKEWRQRLFVAAFFILLKGSLT